MSVDMRNWWEWDQIASKAYDATRMFRVNTGVFNGGSDWDSLPVATRKVWMESAYRIVIDGATPRDLYDAWTLQALASGVPAAKVKPYDLLPDSQRQCDDVFATSAKYHASQIL